MANKSGRPADSNSSDGDGNHIYNEILLRLPQNESEMVFPKLELMRLKVHQVLHEAGDTLKSGYFCNTGMISILTVFRNGESVEVGLVGKEGLAGIPLVAGFTSAANRAVVQVEATALRLDAEVLVRLLHRCPRLERELQQNSQIMAMEANQLAACNQLHVVEQRLARWLLMCQDRVGTATLPLTQEFLSQMLGTRRASVTIAAGILQKAGLIVYKRGHVRIADRARLEESACECYAMMARRKQHWRSESA
jgi:CRP-like cAMP-binding protein